MHSMHDGKWENSFFISVFWDTTDSSGCGRGLSMSFTVSCPRLKECQETQSMQKISWEVAYKETILSKSSGENVVSVRSQYIYKFHV